MTGPVLVAGVHCQVGSLRTCTVLFYYHYHITVNHVHLSVVQQLGNNQRLTGVCDTVFICQNLHQYEFYTHDPSH